MRCFFTPGSSSAKSFCKIRKENTVFLLTDIGQYWLYHIGMGIFQRQRDIHPDFISVFNIVTTLELKLPFQMEHRICNISVIYTACLLIYRKVDVNHVRLRDLLGFINIVSFCRYIEEKSILFSPTHFSHDSNSNLDDEGNEKKHFSNLNTAAYNRGPCNISHYLLRLKVDCFYQ